MTSPKAILAILVREFYSLFYSKYNFALFILYYYSLPYQPQQAFIYISVIYIGILLSIFLFRFATSSKLSLVLRIFIQIWMLVFFWITLDLIHSSIGMLTGENSLLTNVILLLCLILPLFFGVKDLIDFFHVIMIEYNKFSSNHFKRNLLVTMIIITMIVFCTDFVFSSIYSFAILLSDIFGYFHDKQGFNEIRTTFSTSSLESFYQIFYFTISIHFAIPFTGSSMYTKLQELVNNSFFLSFIQIIHMLFAKTIDLLILGLVANRFFDYFVGNKKNADQD